jgi:hypothetical protein
MRWEGHRDNKDGLPGTPKSLAKKRTLSPPKFAKKSAVTRTYGLEKKNMRVSYGSEKPMITSNSHTFTHFTQSLSPRLWNTFHDALSKVFRNGWILQFISCLLT